MAKRRGRKHAERGAKKQGLQGPLFKRKIIIEIPSYQEPIPCKNIPRITKKQRSRLYSQLRMAAVMLADGSLNPERRFTKDDLVGKIIADHIRIGYPDIFHPRERSPNPDVLDITVYSDMTFQIWKRRGDGECAHFERYYFDGKNYFHTDNPYD